MSHCTQQLCGCMCVCACVCDRCGGGGLSYHRPHVLTVLCCSTGSLWVLCTFLGDNVAQTSFIPSRPGPAELTLASTSTSASGFRARVPLKFVFLEALRRPPEARGGIQPVRTEHAQRGEAARQSAQVKVRCSDPC